MNEPFFRARVVMWCAFLAGLVLSMPAKGQNMAIDSISGPVTQHEIDTFKTYRQGQTRAAMVLSDRDAVTSISNGQTHAKARRREANSAMWRNSPRW
jgi:hypothetical protein